MLILVVGLALFLGVHLVRVIAPGWRSGVIATRGEGPWKGIYSLISVVGLGLLIWGYAMARGSAEPLYEAPLWARSFSLVANPLALWLVIASNFPAGFLKRAVRHPMLWGTALWSLTHLLNNADGASVVLFGAFLVWSLIDLVSCYRRPRANPHAVESGSHTHWWPDVVSLVIALALTVAFVSFLHEWLFGAAII